MRPLQPKPSTRLLWVIGVILLLALTSLAEARVILQWYESRWETMERRMPDVFMAGYGAIWTPPTSVADSGGYSVGYDVFDRFNLGGPFWQSLYGTESQFRALVAECDFANVLTYVDLVMNHNGFSDLSRPGFVEAGDYPGFVVTLPNDIDGDFHSGFEGGDLNGRLAGLIDIAQEKNHRFVRQPVEEGNPDNIPFETPRESNRHFYPDLDPQGGEVLTPSGFNLSNPLGGDPVVENANDLLARHARWMIEVIGVDGFRLDAVKHTPQWFWNDIYDPAVNSIDEGSTPFSFGEVLDSDFGTLNSYTRKDGFGNRDVLDFPLFFIMRDVLNGNGFGDMSRLEYASFDASDGNPNDGTRGVMFVSSHDDGAPANDNLGYAHILTRPGFPIVYFNALEFGEGRDFPKRGRGDALGGQFGNLIPNLVQIHNAYARGPHWTRWADGDAYIYERDRSMIVGLNDNGAFAADRTIQTAFPAGTVLSELTGNPFASNPITVNGDGTVSLTIPSNAEGRGFAIWGLAAPRGIASGEALAISPVAQVIAPDGDEVPNGVRRITPIEVVTADSVSLTLTLEDEDLDDNAILRVDSGVDLTGEGLFAGGEFSGFQSFTNADPGTTGQGVYSSTLDLSGVSEGFHYLEAIAFRARAMDEPPTFRSLRKVIYVDRAPPEMSLRFPTQTGNADVESKQYGVVIDCVDQAANSVHVLPDFTGTDEQAIAAIGGASAAQRVDRGEFRWNWDNITVGAHELTVVAYEETGNVSVTRFGNIDADLAVPEVLFSNLPNTIESQEFDEITVLVNFVNPLGDTDFVFDPSGVNSNSFRVSLFVDGVEFPGLPYSPALLGSENTLYQNDNNLGDDYDAFRFNWRGYSAGFHEFEIRAVAISDGVAEPPALLKRTVEVPSTVMGPNFTIVSPEPPSGEGAAPNALLVSPDEITVLITDLAPTARSVAAFLSMGEQESILDFFGVDGGETTLTLRGSISPEALINGIATIRVQASTSPMLGQGLIREDSTQVLILGGQDSITPQGEPVIDGSDNEWEDITPGSPAHTVFTQGREWIYIGASDDARTDLGSDAIDLTEMRVTQSAQNLHFLVRFAQVDNPRLVSFGMALDVPGLNGDLTFIGDESDTLLDTTQGNTWDFTVQVHFVDDSFSRVEVFDAVGDTIWFSPEGEQSYVSAGNDLLEFSIPRSALSLTAESDAAIAMQAATFQNALTEESGGYNNDIDSTTDVFAVDALDVVGGEVSVEDNAWFRATFADNGVITNPDPDVILIHEITIPAPSQSDIGTAPQILTVNPASGTVYNSLDPVALNITTNDTVRSMLIALGSNLTIATQQTAGGGVKTWTALTPPLSGTANSVTVVAFENETASGRSDTLGFTYLVDLPPPSPTAVVDHILGKTPLTGDAFAAADLNGDQKVDLLDLVLRVNQLQ